MKKFITLLVAVVTLNITAQESVLLRINYEKGSSYLTKTSIKTESTMMNSDMNMVMKTKVTDIKNGVFETENNFENIIMDTQVQGQNVHYDMSMKEQDMAPMAKMMHAQMKQFKDAVLLMMFDKFGSITEVKVKAGNANAEQFKNSASLKFPEKAVKVGTSWKDKKVKNGMEMNFVYTVKEITEKFVKIDVVGSISGMAKGDIKGQTTLYKKTGQIFSSDAVTNIEVMGNSAKTTIKLTTENL